MVTPTWQYNTRKRTYKYYYHFWTIFGIFIKIWRSQKNTQREELSSKTWHLSTFMTKLKAMEFNKASTDSLFCQYREVDILVFVLKCIERKDMCPSLTMWIQSTVKTFWPFDFWFEHSVRKGKNTKTNFGQFSEFILKYEGVRKIPVRGTFKQNVAFKTETSERTGSNFQFDHTGKLTFIFLGFLCNCP